MVKLFLTIALAFGIVNANATIVIRGKVKNVSHNGGETSFNCKGNQGVCVRIEDASRIAELEDGGRVIARYSFTSYTTTVSGSGEQENTHVILKGSRKL